MSYERVWPYVPKKKKKTKFEKMDIRHSYFYCDEMMYCICRNYYYPQLHNTYF